MQNFYEDEDGKYQRVPQWAQPLTYSLGLDYGNPEQRDWLERINRIVEYLVEDTGCDEEEALDRVWNDGDFVVGLKRLEAELLS